MPIATIINKSVPCNYNLVFPIVPSESSIDASNELTLNVFGTIIPGMQFENIEGHWQGAKMVFQSGKLQFDPWTVNFVVDSEMKNWRLLQRWMFYINNNKDRMGRLPDDSVTDATLKVVDNFGATAMSVMFKNVWIQQLGEVSFSMREGEQNLESSATFYFDRYEIR